MKSRKNIIKFKFYRTFAIFKLLNMKKFIIILLINISLLNCVFSQNIEGFFTKTIEHNLLSSGIGYNLKSKGDIEKKFFGNFNAPLEFFFNPGEEYPSEVKTSGLWIIRDSLDKTFILEIKYIINKNTQVRKNLPGSIFLLRA